MQALCYDNERPDIVDDGTYPHAVVDLIRRCWTPEPKLRPQFPEIVSCLEGIMIDASMSTEPARVFWKANFSNPLQEHVAWTQAAAVIAKQLGVPATSVCELSEVVLGYKSKEDGLTDLTMERFNQLCLWFGPWFTPSGVGLFREIVALNKQVWFHNDIPIGESIARLHMRPNGCFLVRLSYKDQRTPYTLSSVSNKQTEHRRIYRMTDPQSGAITFAIQVEGGTQFKKFPSLVAIIEDLIKVRIFISFKWLWFSITHEKKAGQLTEPCPRGRILAGYC